MKLMKGTKVMRPHCQSVHWSSNSTLKSVEDQREKLFQKEITLTWIGTEQRINSNDFRPAEFTNRIKWNEILEKYVFSDYYET